MKLWHLLAGVAALVASPAAATTFEMNYQVFGTETVYPCGGTFTFSIAQGHTRVGAGDLTHYAGGLRPARTIGVVGTLATIKGERKMKLMLPG